MTSTTRRPRAISLQPGRKLRVRVMLLSPSGRAVLVRVHALSGVPYLRVRPGERFTAEFEVERELPRRRRRRRHG